MRVQRRVMSKIANRVVFLLAIFLCEDYLLHSKGITFSPHFLLSMFSAGRISVCILKTNGICHSFQDTPGGIGCPADCAYIY